MPADDFNPQVEELSRRYERTAAYVAAAIAALAAAEALRPSALQAARTAIDAALAGLLAASVAWVGQHIPLIYMRGMEEAMRTGRALRVGGGFSQEELRRQVRESGAHREAVTTLAETLRDDLASAVEQMSKDSERGLREIRRRHAQKALAKGAPLSQTEEFAQEMRDRGIAFTDRRGRRWNAGNYAAMALRTSVATTLNYGHINKALEMGSRYVKVFDGIDHDADCRRAHGQVWHVSHAIREPLCHPNGKRSYAALPVGYSGKVDREAA